MSLPSELISQSVFTAALFLVLISVPKLLLLTVWYRWRIFVYNNMKSLLKLPSMKLLLQGEALDAVSKEAEKPDYEITQIGHEITNYTHDIRDPLIESIVALIVITVFIWVFPEIAFWTALAAFAILAIIVASLLTVVSFPKKVNKTLSKIKNDKDLTQETVIDY